MMEGIHQILRSIQPPSTTPLSLSPLDIGFSALLAQFGRRRGSSSAALEYKEIRLVPNSGDNSVQVLFDAELPVKLP